MSDKTIKYVDFEAVPINAVGDVVFCEIRRSSTFYGQETGPYKKGQGNSGAYLWENAWYNPSITSAQIRGIEVTYMDGDRKSTRLNSSHPLSSRMPSSA